MSEPNVRDPVAKRTAATRAPEPREKSAFNFNTKSDEGIGDLVRRLADQGTHLAEKQAELVRAELQSSVSDIKQAGGALAGAAVVGMAGLGVTLMGVAFLVAQFIGLWPATLLVGIVALAASYAMYASARNKLQSQSMSIERTRRTIERAPDAMTGQETTTNG